MTSTLQRVIASVIWWFLHKADLPFGAVMDGEAKGDQGFVSRLLGLSYFL